MVEARAAMAELSAVAREEGTKLNLERRDPAFSHLARGLDALTRAPAQTSSAPPRRRRPRRAPPRGRRSGCRRRHASSPSRRARESSACSTAPRPCRCGSKRCRFCSSRVAAEAALPGPRLEPLGALAAEGRFPSVRVAPLDWETLWRNLFANAIAAGRSRVPDPVRLGLRAEERRDGATGELRLRVVLADDLPGALSAEELRSRPAERGWGVIADILRRNDSAFEVVPAPAPGFSKGIALDLPAIEGTS